MEGATIELREIENPKRLDRLNVLVHPLYLNQPRYEGVSADIRFRVNRMRAAANMLWKMTPKSQNEVTLFIPDVLEAEHDTSLKDYAQNAMKNDKYYQWTDLYRSMVNKMGNGRNIVMGSNLLQPLKDGPADPSLVTESLGKRGYAIDENTEIVVGGEFLEACVRSAMDVLFGLPQVKKIKVIKGAVLTAGYVYGTTIGNNSREVQMFRECFADNGYLVNETADAIVISKPN